MYGIRVDENKRVVLVRNLKFNPDTSGLIVVESFPQAENIEGKTPIMCYDNGNIYYEYMDMPKSQEQIQQEIIDQLILDNLNMQMQIYRRDKKCLKD